MSFYPELNDLTLEELVTRFHESPIDGEEYASVFFSEVAFQIRRKGKEGNDVLWKEFDHSPDEEHLRAIIFALGFSADPDAGIVLLEDSIQANLRDRLLTLLRDNRPLICAEAIDSLASLGEKNSIDAVLELYRSPFPYVVGAVLRFIARLHPDLAMEYLLESLKDKHYIVRENAIDELDCLDAKEAIPYIRQLLTDEHPDVRQAAETALKNLMDTTT